MSQPLSDDTGTPKPITESPGLPHTRPTQTRPFKPVTRRRITGFILAILTIAVFTIANLPYRYVESGLFAVGDVSEQPRWEKSETRLAPIMAGFPFQFAVRYGSATNPDSANPNSIQDADRGLTETRWWSTTRLALNIAVALLVAAGIYTAIQLRDRLIVRSHAPSQTQIRFDALAATILLAFPASLVALQCARSANDLRLAERVSNRGSCYLSCWLPEPVSRRIPDALTKSLARIRYVDLDQPDTDLVHDIVRLPTLVQLQLGNGDFDHQELAPLAQRPHFAACVVRDRDVSDTMLRHVGRCPWLLRLDLAGTNLDGRKLRQLSQLDRLRHVDLRETPLELNQIGRPAWSHSVRQLKLPSPPSGRGDTLTLDGWANLRELTLTGRSLPPNPATLELRLTRLPMLHAIELDASQKVSLIADDLPRLRELREPVPVDQLARQLGDGERLPRYRWFSELELYRVPSLPELSCSTRDLDHFSIRECRGLRRLKLSSDEIEPDGTVVATPVSIASAQSWIDSLGKLNGPPSVSLRGVSLAEVDLTPLGKNRRIRSLDLSDDHLHFDQLRSFVVDSRVEQLELGRCPITGEDLDWILNACPTLQRISADLTQLSRLDIVNNERLTSLTGPPIRGAQQVRLVDLPNLRSILHFKTAPTRFLIRNTPQLQGLMVEGPWPQGATIGGVSDMRWFAVGGRSVDDEVLHSVLDCCQLDRLTIAYGSVSKKMLAEIGRFEQLVTLELPGSQADDSVAQHWGKIDRLEHVCLDDTGVSTGTLEWLANIKTLRSLSLNRIRFNAEAADKLSEFDQLCELRLRDAEIDLKKVSKLLHVGLLESLDVRGLPIDDGLVEAIIACNAMRSVSVSRRDITRKQLARLLDGHQLLRIRIDGPDGVPLDFANPDLADSDLPDRLRRKLARRNSWHSPGPDSLSEPDSLAEPERLERLASRSIAGLPTMKMVYPVRGQFDLDRFRP